MFQLIALLARLPGSIVALIRQLATLLVNQSPEAQRAAMDAAFAAAEAEVVRRSYPARKT